MYSPANDFDLRLQRDAGSSSPLLHRDGSSSAMSAEGCAARLMRKPRVFRNLRPHGKSFPDRIGR